MSSDSVGGLNAGSIHADFTLDVSKYIAGLKLVISETQKLSATITKHDLEVQRAATAALNASTRAVQAKQQELVVAAQVAKVQAQTAQVQQQSVAAQLQAQQKLATISAQTAAAQTQAAIQQQHLQTAQIQTQNAAIHNLQLLEHQTTSSYTAMSNAILRYGRYLAAVAAYSVAQMLTKGVVQAAIDFESAFTGVMKTVDDTASGYERLSEEIRSLAKELPVSVLEIARVAEAAGQLGIARSDITEFVQIMVEMGVSTRFASDEAATALARIANIMNLTQEDYRRVGSTIVDLGNKFATTEKEIVDMSLRMAGVGKTIGVSTANIFAISTALSSLGQYAEAGGSAFSRMIVKIQSAVSAGGSTLEKFAMVAGTTSESFANLFQQDSMQAIQSFVKGLSDIQKNGGDLIGTLTELGVIEVRQRTAMVNLASGYDEFARAINVANEAWRENTALQIESGKRFETTASQIQLTKNAFYDLGITIGDLAKPMVDGLAKVSAAFADVGTAMANGSFWMKAWEDFLNATVNSGRAETSKILDNNIAYLNQQLAARQEMVTKRAEMLAKLDESSADNEVAVNLQKNEAILKEEERTAKQAARIWADSFESRMQNMTNQIALFSAETAVNFRDNTFDRFTGGNTQIWVDEMRHIGTEWREAMDIQDLMNDFVESLQFSTKEVDGFYNQTLAAQKAWNAEQEKQQRQAERAWKDMTRQAEEWYRNFRGMFSEIPSVMKEWGIEADEFYQTMERVSLVLRTIEAIGTVINVINGVRNALEVARITALASQNAQLTTQLSLEQSIASTRAASSGGGLLGGLLGGIGGLGGILGAGAVVAGTVGLGALFKNLFSKDHGSYVGYANQSNANLDRFAINGAYGLNSSNSASGTSYSSTNTNNSAVTMNFYSPKAIDAVEARRQMETAWRDVNVRSGNRQMASI